MKAPRLLIRLLVASLFAGLCLPGDGDALRYAFDTKSDQDIVTISFDGPVPQTSVRRTGPETISVGFPADIWETEEKPPEIDFPGARLVSDVQPATSGLLIRMNTNAFGFINMPVPGQPVVQLHIFRDPIGAKWGQKPTARKASQPEARERQEGSPASSPDSTQEPSTPKPLPQQRERAEQNDQPQKSRIDAEEPPPSRETTRESTGQTAGTPSMRQGRAFFSVPYSMRAEARNVDYEQAVPMSTTGTPPSGGEEGDAEEQGPILSPAEETSDGEMIFNVGGPADSESQISAEETVVHRAVVQNVTPPEPGEPPASDSAVEVAASAEGMNESLQAPEVAGSANVTLPEKAALAGEALPRESSEEYTPLSNQQIQEYEELLLEAQTDVAATDYKAAVSKLERLKAVVGLPAEMREDVLYTLADVYNQIYKDDLENFEKIQTAYVQAMNANPGSRRVPDALINLGLLNLKMGNIPEATAYFNLLKNKYPNDLNVPYISYYWGDYYFKRKEWRKAADNFQNLVQVYPDNKLVREAALGLAQSLDKLGYYQQAYQIMDYIDKRWPRFYVEYPPFLRLYADISFLLEKYDQAKEYYWTFYNMEPDAQGNDIVLARLGDIYLNKGKIEAAQELYEESASKYPDSEGGLVAKMRLAEEGIYDEPTMTQMSAVFDRPFNLRPQEIYTQIVRDHPQSPLAPLALLKLSMWRFFNKDYSGSLKAVQDLLEKYPDSKLVERGEEMARRVFTKAVPALVKDENYGRIVTYWEKYGDMFADQEKLDGDTRMAVAQSFWKRGAPEKALELIDVYLEDKQEPRFTEMALDMALTIKLDQHAWNDVIDLVERAEKNWKLSEPQKRQIDYAKALAYESLGETGNASPLWSKLAADAELSAASRAYAMYYMAKNALKEQDLRKVFVYAQESLTLFLETGGDREKIKDCILMTIYAAESSGRYREALKWANKYDTYIPESDPEWASSRFRLAKLYRETGATDQWKRLMQEIAEKKPETLYGKMASSALETFALEQKAGQYGTALN